MQFVHPKALLKYEKAFLSVLNLTALYSLFEVLCVLGLMRLGYVCLGLTCLSLNMSGVVNGIDP